MSDLSGRIAALAARGAQFCLAGKWLIIGGFCLLGTLLPLAWPDPAGPWGTDPYLSVPEPLFAWLRQQGAGVKAVAPSQLSLQPMSWIIACVLPMFVGFYQLLKLVIASRGVRIAILLVSVPFSPFIWGMFDSGPTPEERMLPAARTGILVDHDGAPAAHDDGTSQPPVAAYRIFPERLPQPLADQARFVLAQQAYMDGDAARMGKHLAGLTGAWEPALADRALIGFMVEHGAAVGRPVAGIAPALSGGAPHSAWRLAAYAFMKWFTTACIALGALCHMIGARRGGQAVAQAQRLERLGERVPPLAEPIAVSFGRRSRAAA